jgi:hypothetical protein
MSEDKKKKVAPVYDIINMTVVRWGQTWAYWRFDVSQVPDEIKLYALKGFIDDLQDCTASMKDNTEAERTTKRRELEKHINAGTRPIRVNAVESAEDKELKVKIKELKTKTFTLKELEAMVLLGIPMSAEQKDKLATFHNVKNGFSK